jgi:hypothetical protein
MKNMITRKSSKAKAVTIIAMTASLYAVFFALSYAITLPFFVLLYLPIVLLGVFPMWFGWSGLAGSMIGAFIGGVYVENLLPQYAWAEVVTAIIIYGLNWILIPRSSAEPKTKKDLGLLLGIYALTLLAGTSYILWQLSTLGVIPTSVAEAFLLPTFALNLPIVWITCPSLLRTISPRLKAWGIYTGSFTEWRSKRTEA